jgi:adenosylcobinamide-phosphate synthase
MSHGRVALMLLHGGVLLVVLIALAADMVVGDPDAVWRRLRYPVVWIGWRIARLDAALKNEAHGFARRKAIGVLTLLLLFGVISAAAIALDEALCDLLVRPWTTVLIASVLIARDRRSFMSPKCGRRLRQEG